MNNNHFYKSSNLIFVYLGLFCRHPYDDYYGSRYESDRFVFKIFRSYTLMLSLCNNLLLFQINFECQSNLLIGIIILLIHLDDTAMKDMIEESKWKNVRFLLMLLYIGFKAIRIYLKKIPITDVLKGKVVNPEEGMQPIAKNG